MAQLWGAATMAKEKPFQFKVFGTRPFLCISSPECVKHMLADNFDNYVKVRVSLRLGWMCDVMAGIAVAGQVHGVAWTRDLQRRRRRVDISAKDS